MSPPIFTDFWDNSRKYGIESNPPDVGSNVHIKIIDGKRYAIQSGAPEVGGLVGVSGGMNPTAVYPNPCSTDYWTCKQAYLHTIGTDSLDRVTNSSIYLLKCNLAGEVKDSIDLEPVIYSIIENLQVRTDSYERVPVAPYWINRYYVDKKTRWDSQVTTASPDYMDIPESYQTHVASYTGPIGGDRNIATNYIRPASYSGILGPVYAGVENVSDLTLAPWKNFVGPADPCNIQVRDIKVDAKDNLWCLIQIGWEPARVWSYKYPSNWDAQELVFWSGYSTVDWNGVTADRIDSTSAYPRQWNPSGDRNRAGVIRPRMFLVCFCKDTDYKSWDYLPFRPGTKGFRGFYSIDANCRGPCVYNIANPPIKLDSDAYGNVYFSVGTYSIIDRMSYGSTQYPQAIALNFNEILFAYARLATEKSFTVTEGLDVGRIGPYPSQSTIAAYQQEGMAYQGGPVNAGTNRIWFKTAANWTTGGDRVEIVQYAPTYFIASTFGNRTAFRAKFYMDTTAAVVRPNPSMAATVTAPCDIRFPEYEYGPINWSMRFINRDRDLLFAHCDLLNRNYYENISAAQYNPASWHLDEERWRKGLNDFTYLHPDKHIWFEVGSGDTENPTGFNRAEHPGFWYTHYFNVRGILTEIIGRGIAWPDARRYPYLYTGELPLQSTEYQVQSICKVASTPYDQGVASGTDFFERHALCGMLPTAKARVFNEDTIIIPRYDFKHQIFGFSGLTWDSYQATTQRYGGGYRGSATNPPWPWRWFSFKVYPDVASKDELDYSQYGARTAWLDPAAAVLPEDTAVSDEDRVIKYTQNLLDGVAHTEQMIIDNPGRTEIQTAYNQFKQIIAEVKAYYWETGLTDLNFGAFSSSLSCNDYVGFMVPLYLIDLSIDDDGHNTYNMNVYLDTFSKKRVYLVKVNTVGDTTWQQGGTAGVKTWWKRIVDWINPTAPDLEVSPALSVSYYDYDTGQIQKLKSWEPEANQYITEKWQQFSFIKWFPKGTRKGPQNYV